jgi:hypothetical protein
MMKTLKYTTLLSILVLLLISCTGNHSKQSNELLAMTSDSHIKASCEMNGIRLYGKVKFVSGFADIKIKYVSSFGDIKVKFVESFPNDCGEWQKVESFPDFTVEVVESFADLKVEVVSSFPGMN